MTTSQGMRTQQRHGILPLHTHPLQKDTLHLQTTIRGRQSLRRPGTSIRLLPTPIKCGLQIQRITNRRQPNHRIRGHDPKISTTHISIFILVQMKQRRMLVPNSIQPRIVIGIPIETSIHPHWILEVVGIVIHKVVCGQSDDSSYKVRAIPIVGERIGNVRNVISNLVVPSGGNTSRNAHIIPGGTLISRMIVRIVLIIIAFLHLAIIPKHVGMIDEAPRSTRERVGIATYRSVLQSLIGIITGLSPRAAIEVVLGGGE
mmetsp:Transcript_5873/g.12858  ORF Transcript_5873/g.12858 Transcript_5873/m.12858 type:complete len:259 (+) Transcript_5873:81-857(+)